METRDFLVVGGGVVGLSIARDYGFSEHYRILAFNGLYLYSDEPAGAFRAHVYLVPDMRNPFLGVHFTVTVDGHVKIGPTEIPALRREQYGGFAGFSAPELVEIAGRQARELPALGQARHLRPVDGYREKLSSWTLFSKATADRCMSSTRSPRASSARCRSPRASAIELREC